MVRLKHRYLLINILYPESAANSTGLQAKDVAAPDTIQFHQPTSDKLTPQLLARMVREGVAELFGDYGSGMSAASLVGMPSLQPSVSTTCAGRADPSYA